MIALYNNRCKIPVKKREKKLRLLVVEDEKKLCDMIAKSLHQAGYEVDTCNDGEEALEMICAEMYDLIVLDLNLPGMDGMDILRELRRENEETKVLILSARSQIADKVEGLDAGANDYLAKPFHSKELLARIRAITRAQTAQANSKLKMGNVTLDRAAFELSTSKGSFRLANKEFQMLELLMCNPHQLISSERFLEKIWGYDSEAEINVVWVYISYLRKKLSALHADIQIKATRNAGYSLEERS